MRPRIFTKGENVLLDKGVDKTIGHKLRGHGDGPYEITKVVSGYAVNLRDAITGRVMMDHWTGQPDMANTDRLMKMTVLQLDVTLEELEGEARGAPLNA